MATVQEASRELPATPQPALAWRLVLAVTAGTLLNPLNSSMIAVALLDLGNALRIDIGAATWLVSAFYVGGAIGMPLMGRLADLFGPRRVFCIGLVLVALSSVLAPAAPGFGWLLALRVIQAFGTSAAYPAGLAIFRAVARGERPPAAALGAISIASSVSAALGPVIGGGLVTLYGWPAIFLVNIPITVIGLILAIRWLPQDSVGTNAVRPEKRQISGARILITNPRLRSVYAQFGAVNLVFYAVFFGLPLWLESARGFAPDATGLLLLPVAGVGVLATPLAARLINRAGHEPALLLGSVLLLAGSISMFAFGATTSLPVLLAVGAVLGIPNAFNNLGLQAALYRAAPVDQMGSAGGFLQTFRYVGAIAATALIGLLFGAFAPSDGLHWLAAIMSVVSVGLIVVSIVG